ARPRPAQEAERARPLHRDRAQPSGRAEARPRAEAPPARWARLEHPPGRPGRARPSGPPVQPQDSSPGAGLALKTSRAISTRVPALAQKAPVTRAAARRRARAFTTAS